MNPDPQTNFAYYSNMRREILPFVSFKPNLKVLDVGCGAGTTGAMIRETCPSAYLAGIELNPAVAERARKIYNEVHGLDLDQVEELPVPENEFNLVLCLDVLEHLVDPWTKLSLLTKRLRKGGTLIVTLPNVRHLKVVLPLLLSGEWRYDPEGGLLDQTHLRFFTRKTALELVNGAGLEVTGYSYTGMEPGSKTRFADRLTFGLFREFFQAGFLFQAKRR